MFLLSSLNAHAQYYWTQQLAGLPDLYNISGIIGYGNNMIVGDMPYYSSTVSTTFYPSTGGHRVYRFLRVNGVLLGVGDSAILKSTDDGQTWAPTTMGFPSVNIGPGARLSNEGNTVYAFDTYNINFGTLIYKSTDGGNTWLPTAIQKPDGYGFLVHDGVIYESALTTLQYSPDNGNNWYYVTTIGSSINDIVAFGDSVFVATNTGVYKTADKGQHWTSTKQDNVLCLCATPMSLLCGTNEHGVWQSDPTGLSWFQKSEDLPGMGVASGLYKPISALSYNDNYAMASVLYDTVNPGPYNFHSLYTMPIAGLKTGNVQASITDIEVYPNPAKDELFIKAGTSYGKNVRVTLRDMSGAVKFSADYKGSPVIAVKVGKIPAGSYIATISNGSSSASKKVEIIN